MSDNKRPRCVNEEIKNAKCPRRSNGIVVPSTSPVIVLNVPPVLSPIAKLKRALEKSLEYMPVKERYGTSYDPTYDWGLWISPIEKEMCLLDGVDYPNKMKVHNFYCSARELIDDGDNVDINYNDMYQRVEVLISEFVSSTSPVIVLDVPPVPSPTAKLKRALERSRDMPIKEVSGTDYDPTYDWGKWIAPIEKEMCLLHGVDYPKKMQVHSFYCSAIELINNGDNVDIVPDDMSPRVEFLISELI
jgi:hypothetical protein